MRNAPKYEIMYNESHFSSNLHSSSEPRPSRMRRDPKPVLSWHSRHYLRAWPEVYRWRAHAAETTADRPRGIAAAPGQRAAARSSNGGQVVTDKPAQEPRPPIYPAEWVSDQTKGQEIKCKACNRPVRPECIWTSCPWKDNWPKTTLT